MPEPDQDLAARIHEDLAGAIGIRYLRAVNGFPPKAPQWVVFHAERTPENAAAIARTLGHRLDATEQVSIRTVQLLELIYALVKAHTGEPGCPYATREDLPTPAAWARYLRDYNAQVPGSRLWSVARRRHKRNPWRPLGNERPVHSRFHWVRSRKGTGNAPGGVAGYPMNERSEELLSTREIAARLRLSPDTVKLWARTGRIPALRLAGNRLRYEWPAVLAALRQRAAAPVREEVAR